MSRHLGRFAIIAAVLRLGCGLESRTEAGIILQTPAGLNPGDDFRFVFVTDGIRDATSTNIADYDSFVNAQAGGATYNSAVVNWLAIGSTDSVDAIDHVGQATAPLYLSDGTLVTTITTAPGLWSGALVHEIDLDLAGNIVPPSSFVWTGTNPAGTGFGGPLGAARPQVGSTTDTDGAWISSGSSPSGDLRNVYGISSVLTVPQTVPEPSALAMLASAIGAGLGIGWTRRRRDQQRAGGTGGLPAILLAGRRYFRASGHWHSIGGDVTKGTATGAPAHGGLVRFVGASRCLRGFGVSAFLFLFGALPARCISFCPCPFF
jgi:hypothetical protein